eukprot:2217399-Alexandrium_andersonii.AAC.1
MRADADVHKDSLDHGGAWKAHLADASGVYADANSQRANIEHGGLCEAQQGDWQNPCRASPM